MNYNDWVGWGFLVMMWICARWAHIVSRKVPDWLHADWNHQATTFLANKTTSMAPKHTNEPDALGEPAPAFRWWTPVRAPHMKEHDHKGWWIPFVGPYLNKDYRGLWTEIWVVGVSLLMLVSVTTLILSQMVVDLHLFRVVGGIILVAWLQALSNVDHKTQFLPDIMTLPLLWLGLSWAIVQPGLVSPGHAIEGAIIGYLSLWGLNQSFRLLRRQDGMGGGDFKFAAAIGAWVGPMGVLMTIGLAAVITLLGAVVSLIVKRGVARRVAFGPSLATAAVIVFLLQPFLWYGMYAVK